MPRAVYVPRGTRRCPNEACRALVTTAEVAASRYDFPCLRCGQGRLLAFLEAPGDVVEGALRAVLLFHRGGPWTAAERSEWARVAPGEEPTTHGLCNAVRRALERLPDALGE